MRKVRCPVPDFQARVAIWKMSCSSARTQIQHTPSSNGRSQADPMRGCATERSVGLKLGSQGTKIWVLIVKRNGSNHEMISKFVQTHRPDDDLPWSIYSGSKMIQESRINFEAEQLKIESIDLGCGPIASDVQITGWLKSISSISVVIPNKPGSIA